MSKLSNEAVIKLAKLSRLKLSEAEIDQYRKELEAILTYVERLEKVDVDGLEPTYQVTGLQNVMRKDEVTNQRATPEELLARVPLTDNRFIKVRRMI
jgi:aspartyl-tRNA(Asn)/glutamyl-tRNA(Gln) amidotransferase subunit C